MFLADGAYFGGGFVFILLLIIVLWLIFGRGGRL